MNKDKLLNYGFTEDNNHYSFDTFLFDNLLLKVIVNEDGEITNKVIDMDTDEEYYLINNIEANGEYVGKARQMRDLIISDIENKCFEKSVFKYKQTKEVIKYIKDKYNDDPLFLWEKYDDNAVFRHEKSKKWYGVLLTVKASKLGLDGDEVEVIDLKNEPDNITEIVDNKSFFRGYHMNKKHWLTIVLDGSVDIDTIKKYIDTSYNM